MVCRRSATRVGGAAVSKHLYWLALAATLLAVSACAGASHSGRADATPDFTPSSIGEPTYLSPPPHPPQFGPFPVGARPIANSSQVCTLLPFPTAYFRIYSARQCWDLDYGLVGSTPYTFT